MKKIILKAKVKMDMMIADVTGQDLIEYALMAGFVAVSAGAIMPTISVSISTIFSKIASVMTRAEVSGGN